MWYKDPNLYIIYIQFVFNYCNLSYCCINRVHVCCNSSSGAGDFGCCAAGCEPVYVDPLGGGGGVGGFSSRPDPVPTLHERVL